MRIFLLPSEYSGDPEAVAMLQAFYSRSTTPIVERLKMLGGNLTQVKAALRTYYLGYGHASIADCGTTTVFIEDVSILAAKALQNNQLYNGQESSTRYISFSSNGCVSPKDSSGDLVFSSGPNGNTDVQNMWLDLYERATAEVKANLTAEYFSTHEKPSDEKEAIKIDKALTARTFDITRSLVPAGAKTNLSWHTTLRKLNDFCLELSTHPLKEVADIAYKVNAMAHSRYGNSIKLMDPNADEPSLGYHDHYSTHFGGFLEENNKSYVNTLYDHLSFDDRQFLRRRMRHAAVPKSIGAKAMFNVRAMMDYGSYRDIQRHRRGHISFPVLTTSLGFNSWYMRQLARYASSTLYSMIFNVAVETFKQASTIGSNIFDAQYNIPLGFNVAFETHWSLDQMVYVAELRSGETVHPTARQFALMLADKLTAMGIPHSANTSDDVGVSEKRGTQDIVKNG